MLGGGSFPIFCSCTNAIVDTNYIPNDADESWVVLPGYRIIIYRNQNYDSQSQDIDNTAGTNIIYKKTDAWHSASSWKYYSLGNEIKIPDIS